MTDHRRPGVGSILAALFVPPLGVFVARGLGAAFWISLVLTLIGWLPGVIFAMAVLFRPDFMQRT